MDDDLGVISKHFLNERFGQNVLFDFVRLYVKGICEDGFSINRFHSRYAENLCTGGSSYLLCIIQSSILVIVGVFQFFTWASWPIMEKYCDMNNTSVNYEIL